MFRWLSRSSRRAAPAPARYRPHLEFLEDRVVPAVSGEFAIDNSAGDTTEPATASSSRSGARVIVWTEDNGFDTDIMAQLTDFRGALVGSPITVANTADDEFEPDVAMDNAGKFVVVWTVNIGSSDRDVQFALFDSSGSPIDADAVAFSGSVDEFDAHVAMNATGAFVVSYTVANSTDDINAKRVRPRR